MHLIIQLHSKSEFNLIQTKTRIKIPTDTVFRHFEIIICTKFKSQKTQNFKKKNLAW